MRSGGGETWIEISKEALSRYLPDVWQEPVRPRSLVIVGVVALVIGASIPSGALGAIATSLTGPHAEITGVDVSDRGPFHTDQTVTARIEVKNTGTAEQTFYVGYDAVGPNGTHFNNGGTTDRKITLEAGEKRVVTVSWTVEQDAPVGTYDAVFAVWGSREDSGKLANQLAKTTRTDAFAVEPEPATVRIEATDPQGDPVSGVTLRIPELDQSVKTNASGIATIPGIDPGDYTVIIKTHATKYEIPVSLSAGETWTQPVNVDTRTSVSGFVQIKDGPRLANVTVKIGSWTVQTDRDGEFQFDHQFSPGSYQATILVDGRPVATRTYEISGGTTVLIIHPSEDEGFIADLAESLSPYNQGIVFGEWGFKHPDIVPGADTITYQLGWLGGSIVPGVDVLADARDCLVKSGSVGTALDCGGLLVSAVGSAGTIASIVGAPVTAGGSLALLGASSSLDTAEDASDIAKISSDVITKYPAKAKAFGGSLAETVPTGFLKRAISKVEDSDVVFKLRKWALYRSSVKTLSNAGVDSSVIDDLIRRGDDSVKQAAALADEGISADAITTLIKRYDDPGKALDEVKSLKNADFSGKQISTIVRNGERLSDALRVSDHGLTPAAVTKAAKADWFTLTQERKWLDALASEDGFNGLITDINSLANDPNNFGYTYEAFAAYSAKTDEGATIEELGKPAMNRDIDVLTKDEVIEAKHGKNIKHASKGSSTYTKLQEQLEAFKTYQQNHGQSTVKLVTRHTPHEDVIAMLDDMNIPYEVKTP